MKNAQLPFLLMTFFVLPSVASASDYERNETTRYFDYIGTPLDTDLEVDFSELTADMVAYVPNTKTHTETLLEFQHVGLYKYCYDASSRTVDGMTYTAPRVWNSCSSQVNGVTKRNDTIAKYYNDYDRCAIYFPKMRNGIRYIVVEGWSYQQPSNVIFKKRNSNGTWSDIASSSQTLKNDSFTSDTLFINSKNIRQVMLYRGGVQHQKPQFITKVKIVTYESKYELAADGYRYTGEPVDNFSVDFTTWTADSLPASWLDADHASETGGMAFVKWMLTNRSVKIDGVSSTMPTAFNNGTSADPTPVKNNVTSNKPRIYLPTTTRGVKAIHARIACANARSLAVNYKDDNHSAWTYTSAQVLSAPGSWNVAEVSCELNTVGETSIFLQYGSTDYFTILSLELEFNNDLVAISESADNSAILSARNGETVDLRVTRTIRAGMYNTFCLPCDVSGSRLKEALGVSECSLKWFNAASMAGEAIDMQFTTASSVQAGAPYLIKTNEDVTESFILRDVVIKNTTRHIDKPSGTPLVKFYGTFNPTPLSTSRNTLVLGANSTLYYVDHDLTMDGMRGYFQLTGMAAAAAPQVRIRYMEDTATDTEAAEGNPQNSIKVIRDGQLLIIRDGVMYNTLGQTINK